MQSTLNANYNIPLAQFASTTSILKLTMDEWTQKFRRNLKRSSHTDLNFNTKLKERSIQQNYFNPVLVIKKIFSRKKERDADESGYRSNNQ